MRRRGGVRCGGEADRFRCAPGLARVCAGGHAVRAAWTLRHGLLAGLTVLSANTCGAGHLLTRHLLKRDIQSCGACGSGALRVRAPFHACRRQRREMHREGGCATGSGRACGASSADTARFANTRSYPGDDRAVKRAGTGVTRRDETGRARRVRVAPTARSANTCGAGPTARFANATCALLPQGEGCLATSTRNRRVEVETFASVINPSSGPLCTVFRVRETASQFEPPIARAVASLADVHR